MTMPDEHTNAVARVFSSDGPDDCSQPRWTNTFVAEQVAKLILTSTDPAVLDALEVALVRAGRLTEQDCCHDARAAQADGDYRVYTCNEFDRSCRTRLVTEWREDT